ncbi:MAG TPA: hypothetical protein VHV10_05175 [Ktedonobacteraceae bacterium]|jgi:hypothetical protein|nr:hypothetical protein [Ktedonobacteraceae bacterium]
MQQFTKMPQHNTHPNYGDNFHIKDETTDTSMHSMSDWKPQQQPIAPYPENWHKQNAAWQPPYPEHWNKQDTSPMHRIILPSIKHYPILPPAPTLVGYLVIWACCGYTVFIIFCQLLRAFPQAIK